MWDYVMCARVRVHVWDHGVCVCRHLCVHSSLSSASRGLREERLRGGSALEIAHSPGSPGGKRHNAAGRESLQEGTEMIWQEMSVPMGPKVEKMQERGRKYLDLVMRKRNKHRG